MASKKQTDKPKRKPGRPSSYKLETANEICRRIALGESLREVLKTEGMPERCTVMTWLNRFPEFQNQYAKAREQQAECWADEIVSIADDGSNDYMERMGKNGETQLVVDNENVQRSRLRVDTRKWLLSKLMPKKYGDLQQIDQKISGSLVLNVVIPGEKE